MKYVVKKVEKLKYEDKSFLCHEPCFSRQSHYRHEKKKGASNFVIVDKNNTAWMIKGDVATNLLLHEHLALVSLLLVGEVDLVPLSLVEGLQSLLQLILVFLVLLLKCVQCIFQSNSQLIPLLLQTLRWMGGANLKINKMLLLNFCEIVIERLSVIPALSLVSCSTTMWILQWIF